MPIIALVGNKGGAGKTTLSINLATGLSKHDSTIVIDADPQGSAFQWRAIADDDNIPEVLEAEEDFGLQARQLANAFTNVVIDCPPSVHAPQLHTALGVCDMALIPVQPSPMDLWATIHIEDAVEEARESNPRLRACMIINQLEARTTLSQIVREALAEIELPVADTAIRRRAIYRTSALEGKSVFNMGSRGADAAVELNNLIEEVLL